MKKGKEEFYLVDLKVLPEAIKKTIKVKELLNDGICGSINEAVKKVDMSRSAYYKYKDHVASARSRALRIAMLSTVMTEEHRAGVSPYTSSYDFAETFARLMRRVMKGNFEILSMNRSRAGEKLVSVTMTLQIEDASEPLSVLEDAVKSMKGIQSVVLQEAMLKAGE